MLRFLTTLIAFATLTFGAFDSLHADGLIKVLPEDGAWASYAIETTITHKDGSKTNSTGTLTVRSVGKAEIEGKACRWLEFEHSWEQKPTELNPRRFHSSITKIAIDEATFSKHADPVEGIIAGYCDKASADQKPDKWNYTRVRKVERGKGSETRYGALDYYVRAPFEHPSEIDNQTITVGDKELECKGIEESETTHQLGVERKSIATTAFQQWTNSEAPFGTVRYNFERIKMDGTTFNQELVLKTTGMNAKASLASVK